MNLLRRVAGVLPSLLVWTLAGTVSAMAFASVFAGVLLTIVFGHPLFFAGGLMLGPLVGGIGGPVFGLIYGAVAIRRRRSDSRLKHVLLSGVLGGVIFGVVGGGLLVWQMAEESQQPSISPKVAIPKDRHAVGSRERESGSSGAVQGTPDGGRVIEGGKHVRIADRPGGFALATAAATAICGSLYGALFGAVCGIRRHTTRNHSR
jgi:hypothetical protein